MSLRRVCAAGGGGTRWSLLGGTPGGDRDAKVRGCPFGHRR